MAVLVVGILWIDELDVTEVGDALDWLFLIFLPNYCFAVALGDLYINHETLRACTALTDSRLIPTDLETVCRELWEASNNTVTTVCCKGTVMWCVADHRYSCSGSWESI